MSLPSLTSRVLATIVNTPIDTNRIIYILKTTIIRLAAQPSQDPRTHDSTQFKGLVQDTAKRFRIKELCADSGYLGRDNCNIAKEVGAMPFIMPKKNTSIKSDGSYAWMRMIRMWYYNRELFKQHYHQRSNVESTFSAMKRKFLGHVRSKTSMAQTNEILCKVVCYNAAVLVNSIFELGIDVNF